MATSALARMRPPEEVAREKTRLLTAAMKILSHGRKNEIDPQEMVGVIAHVIQVRGLSQSSPRDMNLAAAVVVVSLNFALDCVAEVRMTRHPGESREQAAAHILRTKDKAEIFAFAEKRYDEISGLAKRLVKRATVTLQGKGQRYVYDLLDRKTYDLLTKWSSGELSDYPELPLATKAEADAVEQRLNEIATELETAHRANWQKILDLKDKVTEFSAKLFRREKVDQPSSTGSVWHALVLSLMAKALGAGWHTPFFSACIRTAGGVELFVYSDAATAANIIAEILLEPEKIKDRAIQAAARVASVAFRPENQVFAKPCQEGGVHAILNLGGRLLQQLAQEAIQHYNAGDVEKPTDAEVDEFTRTRLFVYVAGDQQRRLARAQAVVGTPWMAAAEAKSLKELAEHLAGFTAWPTAERAGFARRFELGRFFSQSVFTDQTTSEEQAGLVLIRLAEADDGQTLIAELMKRMHPSSRANLARLQAKNATFCNRHEAVLRTVLTNCQWTIASLCELVWDVGFGYAGDAVVQTVARELSLADWQKLIGIARRKSLLSVRKVWEGMDPEIKIRYLTTLFYGNEAAYLFQAGTLAGMLAVLEPVMEAAGRSEGDWKAFEDWRKAPGGHALAFEEAAETRRGFVDTIVELHLKHRPKT